MATSSGVPRVSFGYLPRILEESPRVFLLSRLGMWVSLSVFFFFFSFHFLQFVIGSLPTGQCSLGRLLPSGLLPPEAPWEKAVMAPKAPKAPKGKECGVL